MSQLTIFLSKLMGIYLIVVSLAMFCGRAPYKNIHSAQPDLLFINDHTALLTAGLIALAVSLALIRTHNIWSGGVLPVLVTLVGWILLIISITLLFVTPLGMVGVVFAINFGPFFHIHIYATILLVLGVYMTYGGYRANVGVIHIPAHGGGAE